MGRPRIWNSKKERMDHWWATHPEKSKEYRDSFKERHPEKSAEYSRKAKEKNPNRYTDWYYSNFETAQAAYTRWKKNNPDRTRAHSANRRALNLGAEGSHSSEDVNRILEMQNKLCNFCQINLDEYHVDHIIPLSRGGSNWPENLQCLCPTCNLSKNDKTMDEWLMYLKLKERNRNVETQ